MAKEKSLTKSRSIKHPTQIIVVGFAVIIMIGSIILSLPFSTSSKESIGYINALFTATSAVCVTGLVVVDTFSGWSLTGQITIILLIQIGGLGFMTMATMFSLFLRRSINLKERLIIVESLNQYNLKGIVKLTRRIIITTFAFEAIGAIFLSIRFIPHFGVWTGIYKGIFHSISAFCNAGFDLMGQRDQFSSLTYYVNDPVVNIVVMLLVVIGGIGFAVLDDIYETKKLKKLSLHSKLVLSTSAILLVSGFLLFLIAEFNNPETMGPLSLRGKIFSAMFQSITPRTAGFNTIDTASLSKPSLFVTMILMFIGGSPGSTAGGIKTATFGVILFSVISVIRNKKDTELFNRRLDYLTALRSFTIAFMSALLVGLTTIILTTVESATLVEILFEAISAFGTVGLSMGITPTLSGIGKIAIIITMFLGRVGVLTMALALASGSQKNNTNYRYPEDRVMLG